jgi:hypothetical protein
VSDRAKLRLGPSSPYPLKPTAIAFALLLAAAGCSRQPSGDRPQAEYDPTSGRLRRLAYDANRNGRNDAVSIMDGTQIHRIELDLDENGKVDRWDFYRDDRSLEKVGLSRLNDGVMDSQAFYAADGSLERIEVSTNRDGRFNRVEFYQASTLIRSEDDGNGDGRADRWETYRPNPGAMIGEPTYAIASAAFDDLGRGTPQRRFFYGEHGRVARVEVDPDGDGRFEPQGGAADR